MISMMCDNVNFEVWFYVETEIEIIKIRNIITQKRAKRDSWEK